MMGKLVYIVPLSMLFVDLQMYAQNNNRTQLTPPEERQIDMGNPTPEPMMKMDKVLHGKDSIPYMELGNVYAYPKSVFKSIHQCMVYSRLVHNVKLVSSIAKEANRTIIETGDYLQTLPNKQACDEYMELVEKGIRSEYMPRMKRLNHQRGELLTKLVYRECNSSLYQFIQAFIGSIRAGLWQAFAWASGTSLMRKYDAEGVDQLIERAVLQIEAEQL